MKTLVLLLKSFRLQIDFFSLLSYLLHLSSLILNTPNPRCLPPPTSSEILAIHRCCLCPLFVRSFALLGRDQRKEKMGENGDTSFFSKHWQGWKGFWCDRFGFLENYSKFINRKKPLPSWSDSDVEAFIAQDPLHGPVLRTTREVVKFGLAGSGIGAVSTAGVAWRYSKSPHGALLALGAGAVFGWTFGHEIGNHYFQLYRLDTLTAQAKFLEWWENKTEGGS